MAFTASSKCQWGMRQLQRSLQPVRTFSTPPQHPGGTMRHASNMMLEDLQAWSTHYRAEFEAGVCEKTSYVNPRAVFCTKEINLGYAKAYGFDYDYTLAQYSPELLHLIYKMALEELVLKKNYPLELRANAYDPHFAIRGLHFDVKTGYLFQVDAHRGIQADSVYLGRTRVHPNMVYAAYNGNTISKSYMKANMFLLTDLFGIPEACLIADVIQYFNGVGIKYDPHYLFEDVRDAIRTIHVDGSLHLAISADQDRYLQPNPELSAFLQQLKAEGIKVFLLTNSHYPFVDKGMRKILGTPSDDWRSLFDVIIVRAGKPKWFQSQTPFRRYDTQTGVALWERVSKFDPGEVYMVGNSGDFTSISGWRGPDVVYTGDHIFSDLLDANLRHGWLTAGVIREVEGEVEVQNTEVYQSTLLYAERLQHLIGQAQLHYNDEGRLLKARMKTARKRTRRELAALYNPTFGSVFRSSQLPSYFSDQAIKLCHLYTSRVENLGLYPLTYTFYPCRQYMQHEAPLPVHNQVWIPGSQTWYTGPEPPLDDRADWD